LNITSGLNEVGFFLEILGNPKISELKNSIWETFGKSLGDLGEADRIFRLILVKFFSHTEYVKTASAEFFYRRESTGAVVFAN
jgi:RNase P/RNase MRP subunit POP5